MRKFLNFAFLMIAVIIVANAQAAPNTFLVAGLSATKGEEVPLSQIEVVKGQYRIDGKSVLPTELSFKITIYNYEKQVHDVQNAFISGDVLLPILIHKGLLTPARLLNREFYSEESIGFNALERWRAVSEAKGVEKKPSTNELIEQAANALVRLESPDFSGIDGNHLYRNLVVPLLDTNAFSHLADRVSELSARKMRIEDSKGVKPNERGILRGEFMQLNSIYFLVLGSERMELSFGGLTTFGTLQLKPITVGRKLNSGIQVSCDRLFNPM